MALADNLLLVPVPDVDHLTSDGSSFLLGVSSAGFSSDGQLELIRAEVRDNGYGFSGSRFGYFLYDHGTGGYLASDVTTMLADQLGLSPSDLTLLDVAIFGGRSVYEIAASYKLESESSGANRVAHLKADGSIVPDVIEQVTSQVANGIVQAVAIDSGQIAFQTTAINLVPTGSMLLDDNGVSDVYLIRSDDLFLISQLDGQIVENSSQLLDLKVRFGGNAEVLFSTTTRLTSDDATDTSDLVLSLIDVADRQTQSLVRNSDSTFFDRGVTSGFLMAEAGHVLFESESTNVSGDTGTIGGVFSWSDGQVNEVDLGAYVDLRVLDVGGDSILFTAKDSQVSTTISQVFLGPLDDNPLAGEIISEFQGIPLNDEPLDGTMSILGSAVSFTASDPDWGSDDWLIGGRLYSVVVSDDEQQIKLNRLESLSQPVYLEEQSLVFVGDLGQSSSIPVVDGKLGSLVEPITFKHIEFSSPRYHDGINISDAVTVLKHIVGLQALTGSALLAADMNFDGAVNISDAVGILKHIVGLEKITECSLIDFSGAAVVTLSPTAVTDLTVIQHGDADLSATFEII